MDRVTLGTMKVVKGKVVSGKVVVDGSLPEGAAVTVLASEGDAFTLSSEEEAALLASIAEVDRGEEFPLHGRVCHPGGAQTMSSVTGYPHISMDADGKARIGQSRYKVIHLVAEHYHYGWSAEELLRQHPDLEPGEVYAALTYFYDHHDDLVREMKSIAADLEAGRGKQALSRAELLRRTQKRI